MKKIALKRIEYLHNLALNNKELRKEAVDHMLRIAQRNRIIITDKKKLYCKNCHELLSLGRVRKQKNHISITCSCGHITRRGV